MLQDLLEFTQKKPSPKTSKTEKPNPFALPESSFIQSQTSGINQMTIVEKIKQQKELETAKQRSIEKFLPKKKQKVNIDQFLKRGLDYEQKRQYNIEVMRHKQRDEERKIMQDKPKLTKHTLEIARSKNNPPLYTRTNDELDKRKTSIDNLRQQLHTQQTQNEYKHRNTSVEYYKHRNKTDELFDSDRFETWMNRQNEWKQSVERKNKERCETLAQYNQALSNEKERPKICEGSEKILNSMKAKEGKYNKSNSYTKLNKNKSAQNVGERLYSKCNESKAQRELQQLETMPSFTPAINKNKKYYNIKPRYFLDLTPSQNNNKVNNGFKTASVYKKPKRKPRSVEKSNRDINENDLNDIEIKKNKNITEHWSTTLLRMGRSNNGTSVVPNEILYKLNIMQSSAWNENDINNIPFRGESKNIVKAFL